MRPLFTPRPPRPVRALTPPHTTPCSNATDAQRTYREIMYVVSTLLLLLLLLLHLLCVLH